MDCTVEAAIAEIEKIEGVSDRQLKNLTKVLNEIQEEKTLNTLQLGKESVPSDVVVFGKKSDKAKLWYHREDPKKAIEILNRFITKNSHARKLVKSLGYDTVSMENIQDLVKHLQHTTSAHYTEILYSLTRPRTAVLFNKRQKDVEPKYMLSVEETERLYQGILDDDNILSLINMPELKKEAEESLGIEETKNMPGLEKGTRVNVRYNGSAPRTEVIESLTRDGEYVVVKTDKVTARFLIGQDTSVAMRGGKTHVYIEGLGAKTNTILQSKAGSRNEPNEKNLREKALTSIEGMKEVLHEMYEMDGKDITDEYKEHLDMMFSTIVNPEAIPQMQLYVEKEAKERNGWIDGKKVVIEVVKSDKTASNEQSNSEVYAHEIWHSLIRFALTNAKKNLDAHEKVRMLREIQNQVKEYVDKNGGWKHLMPTDSLNKSLEEQNAKDLYEYIFESKESLQEFSAHSATNPKIIEVMKSITVREKEVYTTLLDRMVGLLKDLWDLAMGRYQWNSVGSSAYDAAMQLQVDLMQYNNKAVKKLEEKKSLAKQLLGLVDVMNEKWRKQADALIGKIDDGSVPMQPHKEASKLEWAKYYAKWLPKLLWSEQQKGLREEVLSVWGSWLTPDGAIAGILRDMSEPDELERAIEKLGLDSDKIDQQSRLIETSVKDSILGKFKQKLSKGEQELLTELILDIDISEVWKDMSVEEWKTLLTNDDTLRTKVRELEAEMLKDENGKWNVGQARGLGRYMSTGLAGVHQSLNSYNVVTMSGTKYATQKVDDKALKQVDMLSTLVALQMAAPEGKRRLSEILERDLEAVEYVVDVHNGAKKNSERKLFSTKTNMIKGYSKEIFDDTVSMEVAPISEQHEMEKQGYTLYKKVGKDDAMYVSKLSLHQTYHRTALRLNTMSSRGMTVTTEEFQKIAEGLETDQRNPAVIAADMRAKREINKLNKERERRVENMRNGVYPTAGEEDKAPVMNDTGIVVDYRVMMSKQDKKKIFDQDTKIGEVLGRTVSSISDKIETEVQNDAVWSMIEEDEKNYYSEDSTGYVKRKYLKIEKNSTNPKVQELYKILPQSIKDKINEREGQNVRIRQDMFHMYFGFRDVSIMDLKLMGVGIESFTPAMVQKVIRVVEMVWKELVKIAKADIVIRTPIVFLANVASNIMYSIIQGRNPMKVAKMTMQNVRNLREYLNAVKEMERLEVEKLAGKSVEREISRLKRELKENPVYELMEAGMYQSIIEDVSTQDLKSSNKISQAIDKYGEKLPEVVKQGMHWMYLTEKTPVYQFMTQATQYSDFVSRATEYQLLREQGVSKDKAMNSVLDTFINYNKPSGSVEEYLNQIGLIMFTKYAKRIQRAIQRDLRNKPVNVLLSILGQSMLFDVPEIYEQHWVSRSYANILNQHMMGHLERAVVPTTVRALY